MKRFLVSLLLACSSLCLAQAPQIKSGATVYIEPMDGYETYLAAALAKKQVPLIVVTDRVKADYIITSTVSHRTPAQPAVVVNNTTSVNSSGNDAFDNGFNQVMQSAAAAKSARGATSAGISVIDAHSSQIVFAYAVGKAGNTNQIQSTAEACAKNLKEFIEKQRKLVPAPATPQPPVQPSVNSNPTPSDQNVALLKEQAAGGDANAASELGDAYYQGQGVPEDVTQAAFWYRKAADSGLADAQYNLGQMYYDGLGVPKDYAQAAQWYRKAADLGLAQAQYNLGIDYAHGEGVPQDYGQAAVWWRKAANQGQAEAQYSLGAMYYNGWGVPQDYAESYFWYDLAASGKQGEMKPEEIAKSRDDSASHLTVTVLLETQERARKWFEDHPAKP